MALKPFMFRSLVLSSESGEMVSKEVTLLSGSDWRAYNLNRTLDFQSQMDLSNFIFPRGNGRPREVQ